MLSPLRLSRFALCAALFSCILISHQDPLRGTEVASATSGDAITLEGLRELEQECSEQITRIKQLTEKLADEQQPTPSHLLAEQELWERLELMTAQRESTREDRMDIQRQLDLARELPLELEIADEGLEDAHSFLELDALRDELLAARSHAKMIELELKSERTLLIDAKEHLADVDQARRLLLAEGTQPIASQLSQHSRDRLLVELRCRVARCQTDLHRERSDVLKESEVLAQTKIYEIETRIEAMSSRVQFPSAELDKRLELIDSVEADIRGQLERAEQRLRGLIHARGSQAGVASPQDTAVQTAHEETQLLQQILTEVTVIKGYWRYRFRLVNGDFLPGEPDKWLTEAESSKRQIESLAEKIRLRMNHWQGTLATLNRQVRAEMDPGKSADLKARVTDLERAVEFYATTQVLVASGIRLYERFINELEAHLDRLTWTEFAQRGTTWLSTIWHFELTSIDDQPITINKLICGLILFLAGYWTSRVVSATTARRIMPKLKLNATAIEPLRTLMFYVLLIGFAFLALDVVNVPLTMFAFMGGAIAIGIGFGSQNILNNFISGLILLVERPIRIGDLVNIEGIDANVEHIGARSTRVRTGANLEILVPNSKFLENNVTNWTLSDTRSRTSVSVGIAYGSPVKPVLKLLEATVLSHPKVLSDPPPIVLFKDFGDNALAFEVHFWVHMQRMMEAARIQSDIRAEIDERFREEGIVISFPQRDVHLDFQSPIEVRLGDASQHLLRTGLKNQKPPERRVA